MPKKDHAARPDPAQEQETAERARQLGARLAERRRAEFQALERRREAAERRPDALVEQARAHLDIALKKLEAALGGIDAPDPVARMTLRRAVSQLRGAEPLVSDALAVTHAYAEAVLRVCWMCNGVGAQGFLDNGLPDPCPDCNGTGVEPKD